MASLRTEQEANFGKGFRSDLKRRFPCPSVPQRLSCSRSPRDTWLQVLGKVNDVLFEGDSWEDSKNKVVYSILLMKKSTI